MSEDGGAWLGLNMGKYADLAFAYARERTSAMDGSFTLASVDAELAAVTRPTTVFSEGGAHLQLLGRWAAADLGGDLDFSSLGIEGGLDLRLADRLTLALTGFTGSDFTGFVAVRGSMPQDSWFDLRKTGMFYGLEPRPERLTGNRAGLIDDGNDEAPLRPSLMIQFGSFTP